MRKALFLCILLVGAAAVSWQQTQKEAEVGEQNVHVTPSITQERKTVVTNSVTSVFVPYWEIPENTVELRSYDKLYYFGVTPDDSGSLKDDAGFQGISAFVNSSPSSKKRYLTVRMLNTDVNTAILESTQAQEQLITETMDLLSTYDFEGVVLDLELSVIPFSGTSEAITTFTTRFAEKLHSMDYEILMAVYGDVFYRARPYNVEALSNVVDGILIMAYDFHKSRGEPGPNFPLTRRSHDEGSQEYPYSFKEMISDFQDVVPSGKLTVLFGMYGYDWTLGPQGLPLKSAKAIPLYQIENGYRECTVIPSGAKVEAKDPSTSVGSSTCEVIVNPISKEKIIHYLDDEGYSHELWYEDEASVEVKKQYMREQGIGSIGYWVWGYY